MSLRIIFAIIFISEFSFCVDRSIFKTCDQAAFCKRHRSLKPGESSFFVEPSSVIYNATALKMHLRRNGDDKQFRTILVGLDDGKFRFVMDEIHPIRPRYQPIEALVSPPTQQKFKSHTHMAASSMLLTANGHKIIVHYQPFRVDFYSGMTDLAVSINAQGLLKFEEYRIGKESSSKEQSSSWLNRMSNQWRSFKRTFGSNREKDGISSEEPSENLDEEKKEKEKEETPMEDEQGMWEEHFKTHRDAKPHGPSSLGVDVTFVGFKHVYGLPEHADSFALKSTTHTDPYRLYNLDVFEYELNNPMALYGSVPYLTAQSADKSVGLLWLNAAETWVDVRSSEDGAGLMKSLVNTFKSGTDQAQYQFGMRCHQAFFKVETHWMSESGLVDMFILLGPHAPDVFRQYSSLTGVTPLPPLFSLAYHQCRWNYNDMDDVAQVHTAFDEHDIPMDVLWLDIEHTDGKKYFTWDPMKFPGPKTMIDSLAVNKRKMVTIIDPHIKKDDGYHVYSDARSHGYFVKDRDGNDYDGHCWPGSSMYLDFLNPDVRKYWAGKFAFEQYLGSTETLFTWNDMNEPSVFSGPEVTMHKDAGHFAGWEHRDVHNIYGFYNHMSTFQGQLGRVGGRLRPFVLTRAFFAGSQRTTAVWTGDNMAEWSHLRISVPMLLSLSTAGIPFVGADIGGFFGNPNEELLVRWYQAGAFQPFFRTHSHIDSRRREPWLLSEGSKLNIRSAIRRRYQLLPYWYTLFYEHTLSGLPVMRPLWLHFPNDPNVMDEERQWLVGSALLVRPVMEPGATSVSLYLPGTSEDLWYEWDSHMGRPAPGAVYIDTPMDKIPVFQRGGTIVPTRQRVRRSSPLMEHDPITLYIAVNSHDDHANGTLYLDDGETFAYTEGEYLYRAFIYKRENQALYSISSRNLDAKGRLKSDVTIERIVIRGVRYFPRTVHLYKDDYMPSELQFSHIRGANLMIIRNPRVNVDGDFRMDIHT